VEIDSSNVIQAILNQSYLREMQISTDRYVQVKYLGGGQHEHSYYRWDRFYRGTGCATSAGIKDK